jgi:glycosyltransferase involved in cell wall biosynthesis
MRDGKIVVARLWQKYEGRFPSLPRVLLRFDRDGFSTIFIYLEKRSDKPNYFEQQGCSVIYLSRQGRTDGFNPLIIWKLAKLLKENKVDILHCHRHKATVYGTIAAKIAKVPVIFSHVHGLNRTRNPLRRFENRMVFRRLNRVLTIGEAVRKDVLASNPAIVGEKVISVGHGINFEKFSDVDITKTQARELLNVPAHAFIFGTVGRLVPTKGQADLIAAFAKVRKLVPQAHLAIVGDGRLRQELKQQTENLGCQDAVTFAGQRNDVPKILRAFDCFVFPSVAEGVGCALLEAMAASLPSIGSSVGGIPEIINDNGVGRLVAVHDVEGLSKVMIEYAAKSEQERAEIGKNAGERVRQYYRDEIVLEKLEKVYREELAKATLEARG